MPEFVMLTKLNPEAVREGSDLQQLETDLKKKAQRHCPELRWLANYAVMGPYDYLDIFYAPDVSSAMRVSSILRTSGVASTETWPAVPWKQFKEIARETDSGRIVAAN